MTEPIAKSLHLVVKKMAIMVFAGSAPGSWT